MTHKDGKCFKTGNRRTPYCLNPNSKQLMNPNLRTRRLSKPLESRCDTGKNELFTILYEKNKAIQRL